MKTIVGLSATDKSVSIQTIHGEIRVVVSQDGSLRLITDIKAPQIQDILNENKDFGQYETVLQVERFGYPEN